jgi:CheY-like chemotaxis protein
MADPLAILLVDDDEVDRLAVKRMLRQAGLDVEVEERSDREGALSAAQARRFDCALLDYRLPGADGLCASAASAFRSSHSPARATKKSRSS